MLASSLFSPHPDATCFICSDLSNCQTVWLLGQSPELCLTTLEIVIKVLEVSNASDIRYVKDFLAVLPTPFCIEQVLLQAVYQLADENPLACHRVLAYEKAFLPELDLRQQIQQAVLGFLQTKNFALHRDYQFDGAGQLEMSDEVINTLLAELREGDRLLVTKLLF